MLPWYHWDVRTPCEVVRCVNMSVYTAHARANNNYVIYESHLLHPPSYMHTCTHTHIFTQIIRQPSPLHIGATMSPPSALIPLVVGVVSGGVLLVILVVVILVLCMGAAWYRKKRSVHVEVSTHLTIQIRSVCVCTCTSLCVCVCVCGVCVCI